MDTKELIAELKASDSTLCKLAAEELIRLLARVDELGSDAEYYSEKRHRNQEIYRRRLNNERTKDLAEFYGVSMPAICRIVAREKVRLEKKKLKREKAKNG